ncbi:glutathione S-transferase family protein [Sabulicella rubraurantiaca]|uniref:glutathione S-transferase family protein n=1 Tax=Sabulicella rubraurantiaca TaxID=2811429 RepID=UPI001A975A38|nr:glutathione S-transferase family protein [Sabulicella rubraurantiaca]
MGYLLDGKWHEGDATEAAKDGRFQRTESAFRNWLGEGDFPEEEGRYHLYVSLACPWAHRTLIQRARRRLEGVIGLSVVHWRMREGGWSFREGPGVIPDPVMNARFLHELYARADPHYSGKVTVPVLWDRRTNRIVSNESSEILRMLDRAFGGTGELYPDALRPEIDAVNERVYRDVNNGVYRAGFAANQEAYEEAVGPLFETLDWLEERLSGQRSLVGGRLTEADLRLWTTLARFDAVYVTHFRCNLRRLVDYPNLWAYARRLYAQPGFGETTNFGHIKRHYFQSHLRLNPSGIVPVGPEVNWSE